MQENQNIEWKTYNPDIAKAMFRAGFIEAWGRGTVEIINDCLEYGMEEPEYDLISGGFKITFYAVDKIEISVSGSQKSSQKIITLMKENQNITINELAQIIGISDRAVKKNIYILKQQNRISRIGSDRAGYWKIIGE